MTSRCMVAVVTFTLFIFHTVTSHESMAGLHISFLGYDMEKRDQLHQYPIVRNSVQNDAKSHTVTMTLSPGKLSTPFGSELVNVTWALIELQPELSSESQWIGTLTIFSVFVR